MYTYAAVVFKRVVDHVSLYDIEINNLTVFDYESIISTAERNIVFARFNVSDRNVSIHDISKYMVWKFKHCQSRKGRQPPICSTGLFANLQCNLEWLVSVINVEFDHHIYQTVNVHSREMSEYKASEYNGPTMCKPAQCDNKYVIKNKNHPLHRASRPVQTV